MCGEAAVDFSIIHLFQHSPEIDRFAEKRRGTVTDIHPGTDPFFACFLHFQHEEPAGPFGIPAQRKSAVYMVHYAAFKSGNVGFADGPSKGFGISDIERIDQLCGLYLGESKNIFRQFSKSSYL